MIKVGFIILSLLSNTLSNTANTMAVHYLEPADFLGKSGASASYKTGIDPLSHRKKTEIAKNAVYTFHNNEVIGLLTDYINVQTLNVTYSYSTTVEASFSVTTSSSVSCYVERSLKALIGKPVSASLEKKEQLGIVQGSSVNYSESFISQASTNFTFEPFVKENAKKKNSTVAFGLVGDYYTVNAIEWTQQKLPLGWHPITPKKVVTVNLIKFYYYTTIYSDGTFDSIPTRPY